MRRPALRLTIDENYLLAWVGVMAALLAGLVQISIYREEATPAPRVFRYSTITADSLGHGSGELHLVNPEFRPVTVLRVQGYVWLTDAPQNIPARFTDSLPLWLEPQRTAAVPFSITMPLVSISTPAHGTLYVELQLSTGERMPLDAPIVLVPDSTAKAASDTSV